MQTAILIGANVENNSEFDFSFEELGYLAEAVDYKIISEVYQNINTINRSFYIGAGKVEEIKNIITELKPDVLIFENDLSPIQYSNLCEKLAIKILDRQSLILEIFAKRAKTHEAKMQVEVARLKYELPRLVDKNANLSQQSGGSGVKNKGAGEKQIDLDRFVIRKKINELEKQLKSLLKNRIQQRKQRKKQEIPTVALVGYTNSGKSTLMNCFLEMSKEKRENKEVFAEDMLFATLDTSVRRIKFADNKQMVLCDTVGFVNNIPTNLIKAFRSTLEEVINADLIIHVIDMTNLDFDIHFKVVLQTLEEIGADNIPIIHLFNKSDMAKVKHNETNENMGVISCKTKDGFDRMLEMIYEKIFNDFTSCMMYLPYNESSTYSYLCDNANITLKIDEEEGMLLHLECRKRDFEKYRQFIVE